MEYDRAGAWEEPADGMQDFLVDDKRAQRFNDAYAEERNSAAADESDLDYQEWLEMDYYFDGYSKYEAKKMAREQIKRERAWRASHPDD